MSVQVWKDMCASTNAFWSAHNVPENIWQENKMCGSWTSNHTSSNFPQYDTLNGFENCFWADTEKYLGLDLSMTACFFFFFFTKRFSVGAGHHQLSFYMCSWGCPGIGWWHYHTLLTATVSLCKCFFSRDCTRSTNNWSSRGNHSKPFSICKCTSQEQVRLGHTDWVRKPACVCMWVSICGLAHDCSKQDKCDTSVSSMNCRFVMGTTSSRHIRGSLRLRWFITSVALMWRTTWWPRPMTSSGTGERCLC